MTAELPSLEPMRTWEAPHKVNAIAIDVTGNMVAAAGPHGNVTLWNAEGGTLLRRCVGSHDDATCAAISPDRSLLAVGGIEGEVRVFDIATGQIKFNLGNHGSRLLGVAFSPDGKLLATTCWDAILRWWNPTDGKLIGKSDGPRVGMGRFCFSPANRQMAIPFSQWLGDAKKTNSSSFLFELRSVRYEDGSLRAQIPLSVGPWATSVPSVGFLFAAGMEDGSVVIWSNHDGKEISRWTIPNDGAPVHQPGIVALEFLSGDRIFAISMSGNGGIWSTKDGKQLAELDRGTDGFVTAAVSPKTGRMALSKWDHKIELFDLSEQK